MENHPVVDILVVVCIAVLAILAIRYQIKARKRMTKEEQREEDEFIQQW